MVSRPRDGQTDRVICARIESANRIGDAGWLHRLDGGKGWPTTHKRSMAVSVRPATTRGDLAKLSLRYRVAMSADMLQQLSDALGVTADSLTRLCVGWSDHFHAYSFPMMDADGYTRGIRLRFIDGRKLAIRGGRDGLFIPRDIGPTHDQPQAIGLILAAAGWCDSRPLLICEGPTDMAAMLDLGFIAIGRPSCTGGTRLLVDAIRKLRPGSVVIVADRDGPGQRGAEALASVLLAYVTALRLIAPPEHVKDVRDWKRSGAKPQDIQSAIDAAPARRLSVHTRRINNGN
jgi:hypothetical protein